MPNLKRPVWLLFALWIGLQALFCQNILAQPNACPEDVETLTAWLIRDLPSYANRVMQRSRPRLSRNQKSDRLTYVVVAGRPEFTPLPLSPSDYAITPITDSSPPQQVFFTTLERQYVAGKAVEAQLFHWLFLVKTKEGWRVALMFTQFGTSLRGQPPTPPQESSNGIVGQAVNNWLRDCRVGVIKPRRR